MWGVDGAGEPVVLEGHERRVGTAAFSLDGTRIVRAQSDAGLRYAEQAGRGLAQEVMAAGGREILDGLATEKVS